jgi:hypothetical protein
MHGHARLLPREKEEPILPITEYRWAHQKQTIKAPLDFKCPFEHNTWLLALIALASATQIPRSVIAPSCLGSETTVQSQENETRGMDAKGCGFGYSAASV